MSTTTPDAAGLIDKTKLTVAEMTHLIADRLSTLPTVRSVRVDEEGALAVALVGGKSIEVQTLPVARALNESIATRRQALDELVKRCA